MKLRLFGIDYTVTLQRPDSDSNLRENLWGKTNFEKATIRLSDTTNLPVREQVLLHEVIHVCCEAGNLGLKEHAIIVLANLLYAALAENGLWRSPDWDRESC